MYFANIMVKWNDTIQAERFHIGTLDNTSVSIWNNRVKDNGWRDKAGGYGVQDAFGMKAVKGIVGDFYNVMGLPVSLLCQMMKEIGVEI